MSTEKDGLAGQQLYYAVREHWDDALVYGCPDGPTGSMIDEALLAAAPEYREDL